jgi:GTP-binding nuclear protein Ran
MNPTYKIVLIGDACCGKSSFQNRLSHVDDDMKYITTASIKTNLIRMDTNYGPISVNLWDTSSQEIQGGMRDGYYIGAHAAVVFFNLTQRKSYRNVSTWFRDVVRVCENIPSKK